MPGFMWDLGFWTGYSPPVSAGPCFPAQPLPKAHTHVFDYGALASGAASGSARSLQPPLAARTSFSRRCRGTAAPKLRPLGVQGDVCPLHPGWAEPVKLMPVPSCPGLGTAHLLCCSGAKPCLQQNKAGGSHGTLPSSPRVPPNVRGPLKGSGKGRASLAQHRPSQGGCSLLCCLGGIAGVDNGSRSL